MNAGLQSSTMTTAIKTIGKILIVDDHVDLADNLAEILANAGYETLVEASAEAGLERISQGGIVALISDYRMPGTNGVEFIREIRRRGYHMPVVMISAFADDDTVMRARAAGAAEVLAKPVDIQKLTTLVATFGRKEALIYLVEDNRELADNLAEALRAHGHGATICGSVAEALLLTERPDAAVLDYRLPDGTGIDVAQALLARHADTPILFVSGFAGELQSHLDVPWGANAAKLEKPVNVELLLSWVAEVVKRGTSERPRR